MRYCTIRTPPGLILLAATALTGCGDAAGPAIHPVTGRVTVDGKPAAKAQIGFHVANNQPAGAIPFAEADDDGTFRPSTRLTGDGAPAGDYTVTVVWPEIRVDHGEEVRGPDRLKGRYGDARTSPLRVTVAPGANTLPTLELKTSR